MNNNEQLLRNIFMLICSLMYHEFTAKSLFSTCRRLPMYRVAPTY